MVTEGIRRVNLYGTTFFEKYQKTDQKPSYLAISEAKENDADVIVCKQFENNRMYGYFQNINDFVKIVKQYGNQHLYELIPENKPVNLYYDIEFPIYGMPNQELIDDNLSDFVEFTRIVLEEIYGENNAFDAEDVCLSGSVKKTNLKNIECYKASYHIVVHCQSIFKNNRCLKKFIKHLLFRAQKPKNENEKKLTQHFFYEMKGVQYSAIDTAPYGKNQILKFVNQSKIGSKRVQQALDNNPLREHLKGFYGELDLIDFYDEDKIPNQSTVQKREQKRAKKTSGKSSDADVYSDFIPRETIPRGEVSLNLSYLMRSIDWNQNYNVWFAVMCACKNTRNPKAFDYFTNWAKNHPSFNMQDNKTKWDSIRPRDNGYNMGTLYRLAKMCNPKIEESAFDNVHTLTSGEAKYFNLMNYTEKYVRPYPINKFNTVICKSPMGSGKTFQIGKAIDELLEINPNFRMLVLSPRQTFARSICAELRKKTCADFQCYLDVKKDKLKNIQFLVCQMESLHKLEGTYDVLIADEIESCLTQFSSATTMREKLHDVTTRFKHIYQNAEYKILSDAFVSQKTLKLVENLEAHWKPKKKPKKHSISKRLTIIDFFQKPDSKSNHHDVHRKCGTFNHVCYIINEQLPVKRTAKEFREFKGLIENMIHAIKVQRLKVVLVCASKRKAEEVASIFRGDVKCKLYHSGTNNKKDLNNVNEVWKDLDLLIYTSSITVGVNFDILHFDRLYIYSSCMASTVRDVFQSSMRVRHLKRNELHYCLYTQAFNPTPLELLKTKDQIKEAIKHMETKAMRFSKQIGNDECARWKDCPPWVFDAHVQNMFERVVSKMNHRPLFEQYLSMCNYMSIGSVHMQSQLHIDEKEFFFKYEDIKYNRTLLDDIDRKKGHTPLTLFEKCAHQKSMFDRYFFSTMERKLREMTYNYFFNPNAKRKSEYFNHLDEIQSPQDVDQKDIQKTVYACMTSKKGQRLKKIKELLTLLGLKTSTDHMTLIEESKMLENYDTLTSQKKELYSLFGVHLKEKDGERKITKTQEIINMLNCIFSRWTGGNLLMHKRKRKRVNGKRVSFSLYKMDTPLDIDTVSMCSMPR